MPVHLQHEDDVCVVTIDRVERANAIDPEANVALGQAFASAAADDGVRVLVLTGAGDRSFCAGMDLRSFRDGRTVMPPDAARGDDCAVRRCTPPGQPD